MSTSAEIADAVVDAINDSGILPSSIEARRVYIPQKDYREFDGEECIVFEAAAVSDPDSSSRRAAAEEIELAIIFAVKLDATLDATVPDANDTLDDYASIAKQLRIYLRQNGPYADARCRRVEADPIYDFEALRSQRVFVTRLRAFFLN